MFTTTGKGNKKILRSRLDFVQRPARRHTSAQNLGNFHITQKITRKKTAKVKVLAASYSASNNAITLTIGKPTPGKALQVMVSGLLGAGGTPVGTFVTNL